MGSTATSAILPLPHLDRLRESEDLNFGASVTRLGDTATLIEDFVDAYEAMNNLEKATEAYDKVANQYADSIHGKIAKEKTLRLKE